MTRQMKMVQRIRMHEFDLNRSRFLDIIYAAYSGFVPRLGRIRKHKTLQFVWLSRDTDLHCLS